MSSRVARVRGVLAREFVSVDIPKLSSRYYEAGTSFHRPSREWPHDSVQDHLVSLVIFFSVSIFFRAESVEDVSPEV